MDPNLKSWLMLILGIVIGWLLGWLVQFWFSRRRLGECQGQLEEMQTRLRARELELQGVRAHAESLETDLTSLRAAASSPKVSQELPPISEAGLPGMAPVAEAVADLTPPSAASLGEIALPEPVASEVEWPHVADAVGEAAAELPEAAAGLPQAAVEALAPAGVAASALTALEEAADDLTTLEGIGPVYAAKLNAAGITRFAQLAVASEAGLAAIIDAPSWRRVNYGEWIDQAKLAAAGDLEGLKLLQDKLFSRKGDNLQLINGVGEKAAAALAAAGIDSFAKLAALAPERLAEIAEAAGVRAGDVGAWIAEAKQRAAGKRVSRIRKASD